MVEAIRGWCGNCSKETVWLPIKNGADGLLEWTCSGCGSERRHKRRFLG